MTTLDEIRDEILKWKTLDNMEKEFVGLTHEEKFKLGCERGYFDRIVSEVDDKRAQWETFYVTAKEKLEKMKEEMDHLIKLRELNRNNNNKE